MTTTAAERSSVRPLSLRIVAGVAAMAAMSPLPWGVADRLHVRGEVTLVVVGALLLASLPAARWAFRSWSEVAITGAVLNLFWFYSVFVDPAAGPWVGLFLTGPYLAFTVAGCIGWFEKAPRRRIRWMGVLLPPALYCLPFIVASYVNRARFGP